MVPLLPALEEFLLVPLLPDLQEVLWVLLPALEEVLLVPLLPALEEVLLVPLLPALEEVLLVPLLPALEEVLLVPLLPALEEVLLVPLLPALEEVLWVPLPALQDIKSRLLMDSYLCWVQECLVVVVDLHPRVVDPTNHLLMMDPLVNLRLVDPPNPLWTDHAQDHLEIRMNPPILHPLRTLKVALTLLPIQQTQASPELHHRTMRTLNQKKSQV